MKDKELQEINKRKRNNLFIIGAIFLFVVVAINNSSQEGQNSTTGQTMADPVKNDGAATAGEVEKYEKVDPSQYEITDKERKEAKNIVPTPKQEELSRRIRMVDDLIIKARKDAKLADAKNEAAAAYKWIVANVPNWYGGDEIMEDAIYKGALVEYYYIDKDLNRAGIGMDTTQSVKYVYRKYETVYDDATISNIKQIKEGIRRDLGY